MLTHAAGPAGGRVLVSRGAGAVTDEIGERLRAAFPDHAFRELDGESDTDVAAVLGNAGEVVVAGGDGTVGLVLRTLAGTGRRVGILPLGTFNNFARSLGIPEDLDAAIQVVRTGQPRAVTLGRVGGLPFLEVAAAGAFGELVALGEAAKALAFGELGDRFRELSLSLARPFWYRLTGDVEREGTARSLVFSNTPTTGALIPVGDATPDDPYLELTLGLVARLATAALGLPEVPAPEPNVRFRRLALETDPPVPVCADAAVIGQTPVTVEALPGAAVVIEPPGG